jgi:hypothetical protein
VGNEVVGGARTGTAWFPRLAGRRARLPPDANDGEDTLMQILTPTPAAPVRPIKLPAVGFRAGDGYLVLFFVAAYLLAWLPFGITILAARGVFDLPAPQALFLSLATLGIGLAGVGMAAVTAFVALLVVLVTTPQRKPVCLDEGVPR